LKTTLIVKELVTSGRTSLYLEQKLSIWLIKTLEKSHKKLLMYIHILYFLSNFTKLKLANIFENINTTKYNTYTINMLKIMKELNYVHNKTRNKFQCY